jgi:hypothetical protein
MTKELLIILSKKYLLRMSFIRTTCTKMLFKPNYKQLSHDPKAIYIYIYKRHLPFEPTEPPAF